ncbi:MAG: hypothetical protein WCK11_05735, partial [Candidatus Falkowbacteria bacterium]
INMQRFFFRKNFLLAIVLVTAATLGISLASQSWLNAGTWAPPTGLPPDFNVATPLNTGTSSQAKVGALTVGTTGSSTTIFTSNAGSNLNGTTTMDRELVTTSTITNYLNVGVNNFIVTANTSSFAGPVVFWNPITLGSTTVKFMIKTGSGIKNFIHFGSNGDNGSFFAGTDSAPGSGLTTAMNNTGVGYQVMQNLTGAGSSNAAFGYQALRFVGATSQNTAVGYKSGYGGGGNVSVGANALTDVTGTLNVGIGTNAANNLGAGTMNVFLGYYSSSTPGISSGVAVGANTFVGANGGTAVGYGARIGAAGTNATVLGINANTNQASAVVLGDATDNALNVGIGTSNPTRRLEVIGGTNSGINTDGSYYKSGVSGTSTTLAVSTATGKCTITISGGIITALAGQCPTS